MTHHRAALGSRCGSALHSRSSYGLKSDRAARDSETTRSATMASTAGRSRGGARGTGVLVARLIDEEIDSLASPSMRRSILAGALADAGHASMPTDTDVLAIFVRTYLRTAMEKALGNAAADEVCVRLGAMLPAPPSRDASTLPPPVIASDDSGNEPSTMLPRDTLRLATSTGIVWIVATDLRRAKTLADELAQLGMSARIAPSVPPLEGTRSALILDLHDAPTATVDAWLRRARESHAVVVAWGGATEDDASNVRSCEGGLSEREVALYCASLVV